MCAILGIFELKGLSKDLRPQALRMSRLQRHRGPDWSGGAVYDRAILAHERLSIVDVDTGAQPLYTADGTVDDRDVHALATPAVRLEEGT